MILPLNEERLYLFDITEEGKQLKKKGIVPVLVDKFPSLREDKVYEQSVYTEEYFSINNLFEEQYEELKILLNTLCIKIGARSISIRCLKSIENNSQQSFKSEQSIGGDVPVPTKLGNIDVRQKLLNTQSRLNNQHKHEVREYTFSCISKGELKRDTLEELDTWIKEKKLKIKEGTILWMLIDKFKRHNGKLEQFEIEEGFKFTNQFKNYTEVKDKIEILLGVKFEEFKIGIDTSLKNKFEKEFKEFLSYEWYFKVEF